MMVPDARSCSHGTIAELFSASAPRPKRAFGSQSSLKRGCLRTCRGNILAPGTDFLETRSASWLSLRSFLSSTFFPSSTWTSCAEALYLPEVFAAQVAGGSGRRSLMPRHAQRARRKAPVPAAPAADAGQASWLPWLWQKGEAGQRDLSEILPILQKSKWLNESSAFVLVMRGLGKQSMWRDAIELFEDMPQRRVQPDQAALNAVLRCCEEAPSWQWAVRLMQQSQPVFAVAPDVVSFRIAISACETHGQWQWCLELLDDLLDRRFLADAATQQAVIRACENGGSMDVARLKKRELQARAAAMGPGPLHLNPARRDRTSFVDAGLPGSRTWKQELFEKLRNPAVQAEEALGIISALRARTMLRGKEHTIVMGFLASRSLWKSALAILNLMPQEGDEKADVMAYTVAISACKNVRQWQHALQLIQDMITAGVFPDVAAFNAAISACGKAGQWLPSLLLLKDMVDEGLSPDVISFNVALEATAVSKQGKLALNLLAAMRKQRLPPEVYSYNSALRACESFWHEALAVLEDMREEGLVPGITQYDLVIHAAGRDHQWGWALELLALAQHGGMTARASSYEAAIGACLVAREKVHAWRLFAGMQRRSLMPEQQTQLGLAESLYGGGWQECLEVLLAASAESSSWSPGRSTGVQRWSSRSSSAPRSLPAAEAIAPLLESLKASRAPGAELVLSALSGEPTARP
ncbi:unnamed protein product [Polarella glacialis]|uniref:Pentacotripeptide-repeat region of PRORP domain-containing protein n=2 Tax=Polarella glacialis TaxID=89957 RepID=A0A813K436_POLGL|nr:unnamed protein product [Polarella glacialis]